MYKQISIKNLKIFKDEQKLKIAPITLLYGENSSGKTSLLKTFDIVHNIFSEQQVKRGKNIGQKDSPFYRNENISYVLIFLSLFFLTLGLINSIVLTPLNILVFS